MSLLERYYLKDNPFTVVPSKTRPIWADRKKFRNDVEEGIKFSLSTTPSQIIACIYGDWGCGKTHAMNYFSNDTILGRIAKEVGIPPNRLIMSIPTIFPIKDVLNSLYLEIIYRNLIPRLNHVLTFLHKQTTPFEREGQLEEKLVSFNINEDLAKVLAQFTIRKKSMLVRRYLSMNTSRSDLNSLGVAKGIDTPSEMLNVLADMLKLFTKTVYSRILIWIDDCERIDEVSGRFMFEFQYFLRDALDLVPERLTFMLNFTLYPGEEIPERLTFLGPAVQHRISKIISVGYFDHEDYLQYIDEILEQSRQRPKAKVLPKYFPFSEKCLDNLFEMLRKSTSNLQPRTVNRVLTLLVERGLHERVSLIDEKFLDTRKGEVKAIITS